MGSTLYYIDWVPEVIHWSAEGLSYIGSRWARYPGAVDVDPDWTQDVLTDPDLIAFEPDPKRVSTRRGSSANPQRQGWCSWWWVTAT